MEVWKYGRKEKGRGLEVKPSMALFIRARLKKQDGWASLGLTEELNICNREPQAIAGGRGDWFIVRSLWPFIQGRTLLPALLA